MAIVFIFTVKTILKFKIVAIENICLNSLAIFSGSEINHKRWFITIVMEYRAMWDIYSLFFSYIHIPTLVPLDNEIMALVLGELMIL